MTHAESSDDAGGVTRACCVEHFGPTMGALAGRQAGRQAVEAGRQDDTQRCDV